MSSSSTADASQSLFVVLTHTDTTPPPSVIGVFSDKQAADAVATEATRKRKTRDSSVSLAVIETTNVKLTLSTVYIVNHLGFIDDWKRGGGASSTDAVYLNSDDAYKHAVEGQVGYFLDVILNDHNDINDKIRDYVRNGVKSREDDVLSYLEDGWELYRKASDASLPWKTRYLASKEALEMFVEKGGEFGPEPTHEKWTVQTLRVGEHDDQDQEED